MTSGIYEIRNIVNGKSYVGRSINLSKRLNDHLIYLRKGCHPNQHLQNSWNKYGSEQFEFNVLEHCEEFKLIKLEQSYLDKQLNSPELFYNRSKNAKNSGIPNEITRGKMSESAKRRGNNHLIGWRPSVEARKKMSLAKMGKHLNPKDEFKKGQIPWNKCYEVPKHDLSGKIFGQLVVIEYAQNGKWLCKCSCGNTKELKTGHLNTGKLKSCGCIFKSENYRLRRSLLTTQSWIKRKAA